MTDLCPASDAGASSLWTSPPDEPSVLELGALSVSVSCSSGGITSQNGSTKPWIAAPTPVAMTLLRHSSEKKVFLRSSANGQSVGVNTNSGRMLLPLLSDNHTSAERGSLPPCTPVNGRVLFYPNPCPIDTRK